MPHDPGAFRHHPQLAGLIRAAEASVFRTMQPADHDDRMLALGYTADWRYSDAVRGQMLADALAPRAGRDLWVFAYGSLMWDPGFNFSEVRRARVPGLHRSFCLVDRMGARGTPEVPGLMAALDQGGCCDGLAFCIPADQVPVEAEVVWRREMISPGYNAVFVPAETAQGEIEVLTFCADHAVEMMQPGLPHETQVRYIATGEGLLGTSREYLENTIAGCRSLGIEDPALDRLMRDVEAFDPAQQSAASV